MPTAAAPDPDENGGTAFADPLLLDELAHQAEEADAREAATGQPQPRWLDPRVVRAISNFVAVDDAPKIDARQWAAAPGFPEQFVDNVAGYAPPHRLRQLRFADGRIVYELWTPVHKRVETTEEMRLASLGLTPIAKWKLTYHLFTPHWCDCPRARLKPVEHSDGSRHMIHPECGREKKSRVDGPIGEHFLSLSLAPEDDATYNGFYPTLPGQDVVQHAEGKRGMEAHRGDPVKRANPLVINGKLVEPYLRGGTYIAGGRAEHRRRTKGLIHLGPGYTRDVEKIQADKEAKKKASLRLKIERTLQLAPPKPFEL